MNFLLSSSPATTSDQRDHRPPRHFRCGLGRRRHRRVDIERIPEDGAGLQESYRHRRCPAQFHPDIGSIPPGITSPAPARASSSMSIGFPPDSRKIRSRSIGASDAGISYSAAATPSGERSTTTPPPPVIRCASSKRSTTGPGRNASTRSRAVRDARRMMCSRNSSADRVGPVRIVDHQGNRPRASQGRPVRR